MTFRVEFLVYPNKLNVWELLQICSSEANEDAKKSIASSQIAWHSGPIPEKSIPNPSLVFGLVGLVESVGYPFSLYKQLVNWISLWIFVKPILCSIW